MARAVVVLAPGFEEIEAITQVDVLRRAGVEVVTAAVGAEKRVEGSHGIAVEADVLLSEAPPGFKADALVLPGGMPGSKVLGEDPAVQDLIRRAHEAGKIVAAICAAPAMALGSSKVLEGKRATCYPGFESRFPKCVTHVDERVVVDGTLITSRGPGTALEFALTLVEHLVDPATAAKLLDGMLVGDGRG